MATATFKCLASGQTVTFIHQVDIDSMKGHSGYVEVTQEEPTPAVESTTTNKKTTKKSATNETEAE
jgi:hypothetical protein